MLNTYKHARYKNIQNVYSFIVRSYRCMVMVVVELVYDDWSYLFKCTLIRVSCARARVVRKQHRVVVTSSTAGALVAGIRVCTISADDVVTDQHRSLRHPCTATA